MCPQGACSGCHFKLCTGLPAMLHSHASLFFWWKRSRLEQELLIYWPNESQYHAQNQRGWGCSRASGDISEAGHYIRLRIIWRKFQLRQDDGTKGQWPPVAPEPFPDAPALIQAAKGRPLRGSPGGHASCLWSAEWRNLSGAIYSFLALPKCR